MRASVKARFPTVTFLDLFFADDMTILITSPNLQELSSAAHMSDAMVKEVITIGTLQIQIAKTRNLLLDPRIIKQGI